MDRGRGAQEVENFFSGIAIAVRREVDLVEVGGRDAEVLNCTGICVIV
jgi:hypothetical protein